MTVYNNEGRATTAANVYYFGEQSPVDLQQENDIFKQRCAFHANPEICHLCKFKCPYRKKWSSSND